MKKIVSNKKQTFSHPACSGNFLLHFGNSLNKVLRYYLPTRSYIDEKICLAFLFFCFLHPRDSVYRRSILILRIFLSNGGAGGVFFEARNEKSASRFQIRIEILEFTFAQIASKTHFFYSPKSSAIT